jgi:hypothetical protein
MQIHKDSATQKCNSVAAKMAEREREREMYSKSFSSNMDR